MLRQERIGRRPTMALNLWWADRPAERYSMEITDPTIVGDDLLAPQLDGAGNEQWSYTLVTETRPGDCPRLVAVFAAEQLHQPSPVEQAMGIAVQALRTGRDRLITRLGLVQGREKVNAGEASML